MRGRISWSMSRLTQGSVRPWAVLRLEDKVYTASLSSGCAGTHTDGQIDRHVYRQTNRQTHAHAHTQSLTDACTGRETD